MEPENPPLSYTPDPEDRGNIVKKILNKKILFLILGIILVISLLSVSLAYLNSQKLEPRTETVSTPKTWQIIFTYNPSEDSFKLKSLVLLQKKIVQDNRSAKFSIFTIKLLNPEGKELYSSKVSVSTGDIYSIDESFSAPQSQRAIENIIYVPYVINGTKIILTENEKTVLNLELPKEENALAPKNPQRISDDTCLPLVVVFVADGYSDFSAFHNDVDKFKKSFLETAPYSSYPGMFDFKYVDNTTPLGCKENGLLACFKNKSLIDQLARAKYPSFTKVVVIANAPEKNPKDGGVLGVASGIGGTFTIFPNNFGNITNLTLKVANHELLGHAVGLLYDRYVFKGSSLPPRPPSNCSEKPQGEAFWSQTGTTNPTLGCYTENLYAPQPPTCSTSSAGLSSGGNPNTLMSSASCGGLTFDNVETAWIKDQILPDYISCSSSTQPTTTPVVTNSEETPSPTTTPDVDPFDPALSPVPEKVQYECHEDPNCKTYSSVQLCKLICTPTQ